MYEIQKITIAIILKRTQVNDTTLWIHDSKENNTLWIQHTKVCSGGKYNCTLGAQVNLQARPIGGGGISANLSANGRTHLLFTDLTRFCSSQIDKIWIQNVKYKIQIQSEELRKTKYKPASWIFVRNLCGFCEQIAAAAALTSWS